MCDKVRRFCSIPSRLLSGDPSALLTPLAQYFSDGLNVDTDLLSPYSFQFDTNQVPDSQFWNLPKIMLSMFNPSSNLAPNLELVKLFLMPNNLVGTLAQAAGGGVININNAGIEIEPSGSDLINANANAGGWQSVFYSGPIVVPPRWFLRVVIYDDGNATVNPELPAGTMVTLRALQQIVPANFASMI